MTCTVRLLTAVFVLVPGGCCTFLNVSNEGYRPYGGTMMDVAVVSHFPTMLGILTPEPGDELGGQGADMVCLACMALLDLPFSVATDTLTLPITASVSIYRLMKVQSPPERAAGEAAPSEP